MFLLSGPIASPSGQNDDTTNNSFKGAAVFCGALISSGHKTSETVRPLANEWQGKSRRMSGPNRKNLEGNIDNSNVHAKKKRHF